MSALGLGGSGRTFAQESTRVVAREGAFPANEQLALATIVHDQMGRQFVPGVVAGVWIPGHGVWTHAAGLGDLQTAAPITTGDHVRIASVTKTFVATAVLQLMDEGVLGLEDTLERFVPGIPNGDQITIRQLLGMSAGIFNFVDDAEFDRVYTENPLAAYTPADEIDIMRRHPAEFAPGAKTQYSDSNYVLLGEILVQVTGQPVGEVLATRIFAPLGLAETSYPENPEMPAPFAHGYGADPGSANLRDLTLSNPVVANAAGAVISTLHDLRIWARALASGALLAAETQAIRLQAVPIFEAPGFQMGYGLGIMEINGFYGHNGAIFGYSTWMLHAPRRDATVVVLANRGETQTEFAGPIALELLHFLFPEDFPRQPGPPAATPEG